MRLLTLLVVASLLSPAFAAAGGPKKAILYKTPECGCCEGHADHLRDHGFTVTSVPRDDLPVLRRQYDVPPPLAGCHMILIDGYVVEGHVPARVIEKLLTERPAIAGISLPGMPDGSPGMPGPKREPFVIYEIGTGEPKVFAVD